MQRNNAKTITTNSFWYIVDVSAATLVMLIASVPVARIMGPEVLGQYIYLVFLTSIAQRLANVGIPATAGKYMSEYIGAGEPGLAHQIFLVTLRYQFLMASVVTLGGCAIVFVFAAPQYRLMSFLMVVSMWPSMMNNIPAQANVAAENLRLNIPASFVNFTSYSTLVVLTLVFRWGLVGLASATLLSRSLEALVRYRGTRRWLRAYTPTPIGVDLRRRMFAFSRQNLLLLAFGLVVWDRSELLFLKHFSGAKEVAFYSLAFSITNQLLMAPRALSSAIGVTVFAQFGRDPRRLEGLIQNATRYVGLLTLPLFLGLAAIASPLIRTVYGSNYLAVIPVLWILSIFAIPRGFQSHTENVLQATESQGFMVRWLSIAAVMNLILDWILIPRYGALGAAFANGIAQTFAIAGVWMKARSVLRIHVPGPFLGRLGLSGLAILATVLPLSSLLPPPAALLLGIPMGVVAFSCAVRLTGCLDLEDWARFKALTVRMPDYLRKIVDRSVGVLIPSVHAVSAPPATQL